MEWLAARKCFQPSADWRYTVSAAQTPNGYVYTAWRCQKPVAKPLAYRDNAQECRQICEADEARRGALADTGHEESVHMSECDPESASLEGSQSMATIDNDNNATRLALKESLCP